jgi:hypothetical protein
MTDSNERPDDRSTPRIEAALARLGAEHEPPVGWEARVMAAVGATRRRWWMYAAPGVALAAAAAVAVVVLRRPPPALALNVKVKHSALYRGDEASAGDVAHIVASGGTGPRAIWIYHEEVQLVLRCPGDPRCRVSDASIEVDLTLTSAGTYTMVALTAVSGLPPLTGTYDADTAAAKDAGLDVRQSRLTVQ